MPTPAEILKNVRLFADLNDAQRQRLAAACRRKVYHERIHIFHQGDPGSLLYIVLRGGVRIYSSVEGSDQETTLAVLTPGDFFGEMALLLGDARSASAVTIAPETELLQLDQTSFEAVLRDSFELTRELMRSLALRLIQTNENLVSIAANSSLARVCKLMLARANGQKGPLCPAITQEEIASLIGARRETVARNLARLEEAKALVRNRGHIELLDLKRLEMMARTG